MSSGQETPTFSPNPTPFGFGFTNEDEKMELSKESNVESVEDVIEDEIEDYTPRQVRRSPCTEIQVRTSSVEALGQMVALITRPQLKAALPRLVPTILELYKRDQDIALLATCSLHNLLNASLLSENGPPLLDFETYNEVQRCFLTVGLVYPKDLFMFLLNVSTLSNLESSSH